MSLGYAERLSFREDLGGRLGAPELDHPPHVVLDRATALAELVRSARHIVAYTGAGISTACGIPDFRGPNGVWTAQRRGLPMPRARVSFLYAQPSLTHMALLGLLRAGKLPHICSQNVDSLHLRSGVPRASLSELHGNCFAERCPGCAREYVRDFEMDSVGFKPTGRLCVTPGCGRQLVDSILDWEDALPPDELRDTERHGSAADLAICLGTSLQIVPAANLPLRTVRAGGRLAIINLQATPKDKHAAVVVHAKVDQVMALVMQRADVPIPDFVRTDRLQLSHKAGWQQQQQQQQQQQDLDDGGVSKSSAAGCCWDFTLTISSVHGAECPLPMVASASVTFLGRPPAPGSSSCATTDTPVASIPSTALTAAPAAAVEAAAGGEQPVAPLDPAAAAAAPAAPQPVSLTGLVQVLPAQQCDGPLPWRVQRSCPAQLEQVVAVVVLTLADAADEGRRTPQLQYTILRPAAPAATPAAAAGAAGGRVSRSAAAKQRAAAQAPDGIETFSFVSQVLEYGQEQQRLVAELEAAAVSSREAAAAAGDTGAAVYDDEYDEDDDDDGLAGSDPAAGDTSDEDFQPGSGGRSKQRAAKRAKK